MERTFQYSFTPVSADPVGAPRVKLSVDDIEDAALREVLQTPGPALASWDLLNALLTATGANSPFLFREPLGRAREVKVALSGLFGRFVARAYLERYFGLSIFTHLGNAGMTIDARRRILVVRKSRGDLPDWVACSSKMSQLTIAEAKGCHDRPGPAKALARAWTQTQRVDITCKHQPVTVKRVAIATRWGSAIGGAPTPMLWVRDPEAPGTELSSDDERALFVGLLRRHLASLLGSLGHTQLSESLMKLVRSRQAEKSLVSAATIALEAAPISSARQEAEPGFHADDMIGGVVTRRGIISNVRLSAADEKTLARLDLRPAFVGVERRVIQSAIHGEDISTLSREQVRSSGGKARGDGAGVWIVSLDT